MRWSVLVACLAVVSLPVAALPAQAAGRAGGISLASSGITSVETYTNQDSSEGFITFTITDPQGEGAYVSQCSEDGKGIPGECDTYPLEESEYRNGAWRIRPTDDGWELRVYIGYYPVSENDCWKQTGRAVRAGVNIAILGNDEEVLIDKSHQYALVCQGFTGKTQGGGTITAKVGRASQPMSVTFTVVDAAHTASFARGCYKSMATGRLTGCSNAVLTAQGVRTTQGWRVTTSLSMAAVSAPQCRALQRKSAKFQYVLTFKTAAQGSEVYALSHPFSVTC